MPNKVLIKFGHIKYFTYLCIVSVHAHGTEESSTAGDQLITKDASLMGVIELNFIGL